MRLVFTDPRPAETNPIEKGVGGFIRKSKLLQKEFSL